MTLTVGQVHSFTSQSYYSDMTETVYSIWSICCFYNTHALYTYCIYLWKNYICTWMCVCVCVEIIVKDVAAGKTAKCHFKTPSRPRWDTHWGLTGLDRSSEGPYDYRWCTHTHTRKHAQAMKPVQKLFFFSFHLTSHTEICLTCWPHEHF